MKRLLRPLAVLLPIWSAACASLPGVSIVAPPPSLTLEQAPSPALCLQDPLTPQSLPIPELPALIAPPPGEPRETVAWWRGVAQHFESRARRAELTQSYAVNVADAERDTRETNATVQIGCADRLRARDETPVG